MTKLAQLVGSNFKPGGTGVALAAAADASRLLLPSYLLGLCVNSPPGPLIEGVEGPAPKSGAAAAAGAGAAAAAGAAAGGAAAVAIAAAGSPFMCVEMLPNSGGANWLNRVSLVGHML